MSKIVAHHHEAGETNGAQTSSHHEGNQRSSDATFSTVQRFTNTYGLTQHVRVFRKAAVVLQGDTALEDIPLTAPELQALKDETNRKWHQPKMLYFTILVCSVGAMEQGWAQTGMNGANLYFPKAFGIGSNSKHDNFVVGLINSGIYLSTGLV